MHELGIFQLKFFFLEFQVLEHLMNIYDSLDVFTDANNNAMLVLKNK